MDLEMYANRLVEELILLKDKHKQELSSKEIDTLNNSANIIYHNRKVLESE